MKAVSAEFQAHLDSGATTLCYCWKLTRNDGVVQGFTDHDDNLTFDGVTYEASTGFTSSQFVSNLGLAVDNSEIEGALSSDSLNEDDLALGHYDNALVEVHWVNWRDVTQRHMVSKSHIGEVTRQGVLFSAEIRGLANPLQQKTGRKYQRYCDAVVGDARCGLDLETAIYKGSGVVSQVSNNRVFTASYLNAYSDDWFTGGLLTWTTGANASEAVEVKRHQRAADGTVTINLWHPTTFEVLGTDTFSITVGCHRDAETCQGKFSNIKNFRGFNLIPGADALLFYPKQGDDNLDGGSLFK